MTRRKREIIGLTNERDFPHLVELTFPPGGFRSVFLEIDAFHRERRIPVRRGRIQSLPQELTVNRDRDCLSQHGVVIPRLLGQREQLKKNVEVKNYQNRGSDQEETDEGQVYVEQRQLDRVFEKQIPVRHRSEGDHEVKLEGYEGCPETGGLAR